MFYSGYADGFEDAQFGCIAHIEGCGEWHAEGPPEGNTIEDLLIELKRMESAVERPAISWEEWQAYLSRVARFHRKMKKRHATEAEKAPRGRS